MRTPLIASFAVALFTAGMTGYSKPADTVHVAATTRAADTSYLGKGCYGFFALDVEYLATKSASGELFRGNAVRNLYTHLMHRFPKMDDVIKETQFDPMLDFYSSIQELQLIFVRDGDKDRGFCGYIRGKASKDGFVKWMKAAGPKFKFTIATTTVEGQEVFVMKKEGESDSPALAFVDDGVLIGNEFALTHILKNRNKDVPPELAEALKARAGKAAVLFVRPPKENVSFGGEAWIEGGKLKGKLNVELMKNEIVRLPADIAEANKVLGQFKAFQGIALAVELKGETTAIITAELDDAKIKDYLRALMTPQLDPAFPISTPEATFIPLPSQSINNLYSDAGGHFLAATQYGSWGDDAKPGAYHLIDLDAGKVVNSTTCKYDANEKIAEYPADIMLHSKAGRYFLSTYNSFNNSKSYGSRTLINLKSHEVIKPMNGSRGAFSPDGKLLALEGYPGVLLVNPDTGEAAGEITAKLSYSSVSKWSGDSLFLASYSGRFNKDQHIVICDIAGKKLLHTVKLGEELDAFDWLGSDKLVLVSRKTNKLTVWDLKADKAVRSIDLPPSYVGLVQDCRVIDADTVLLRSGFGVYTVFHLDKGIVKQIVSPVPEVGRAAVFTGPDRVASHFTGPLVTWKWR